MEARWAFAHAFQKKVVLFRVLELGWLSWKSGDLDPKNKLNWANVSGLLLAFYLGRDGLALWVFVVVLACV